MFELRCLFANHNVRILYIAESTKISLGRRNVCLCHLGVIRVFLFSQKYHFGKTIQNLYGDEYDILKCFLLGKYIVRPNFVINPLSKTFLSNLTMSYLRFATLEF